MSACWIILDFDYCEYVCCLALHHDCHFGLELCIDSSLPVISQAQIVGPVRKQSKFYIYETISLTFMLR